jgi:hypothetical protein
MERATTATLTVTLRDDDPRSFEELVENVQADVEQLLEGVHDPAELEDLEYDLLDLAGQWVPSNEALIAIYGDRFLDGLMLDQMPSARWQDFLESHAEPPPPSRIIFEVVRSDIYERLDKLAREIIAARLESAISAGEDTPGTRSRPSGLADG